MRQFLLAWICVAALVMIGAFVSFEVSASLVFIVCVFALIARLQGKGNWAVSDVVRDIRGAVLRLLSHLLLTRGVVDKRRSILALMVLAGLAAILLPPWTSETNNRLYHQQQFEGYAFMLAPPKTVYYQSIHIDYGRLGLEFASIILTGGLLFLLFGSSESRRSAQERPTKDDVHALLQLVVKGFHGVANKRGESLSEADVKRICAFFYHQQQTFGLEFTREHLHYELEKYQREGLRDDYRA
jgi:hypothetical protein